ncbi:DNA mismatch repair endonuclease MutL [Vibrio profundi]|uniref:DNA mismatch repair endonuclease MutL n=1 Tax=Vibrio profundi TaxID=1774960 RepID=UPI00373563A4
MTIKILPARLANQIAAGEVVERPASVVKELVENSLDSGATRIDIDIEKGGAKMIRVRDNGKGIVKDELALALSRHATSKIHTLDDLEAIVSLGFRGEALASISSVARLTMTSRPTTQEQAWAAYSEGRDMQVKLQPAAHPIGTSVEVLDLFFNTPARRKFLRTEKTEFTHIDELLKRIALSRFDVTINLRHNGKMIRQYRAAKNDLQAEKRIAAVCGNAFVRNMLKIELEHQGLKLHGWITTPEGARQQSDLQYCYVNGRMMRDKLINHAIRQSYETSLRPDQFATYVLFIELDPHQVDVNVHPAKHEVRFHQARLVHDFIYQALSDGLAQTKHIDATPVTQSAFHQPSSLADGETEQVQERVSQVIDNTPAYPRKAPSQVEASENPTPVVNEKVGYYGASKEFSGRQEWIESRPAPKKEKEAPQRFGEPTPSKKEVRAYKELLKTPSVDTKPNLISPPEPSENAVKPAVNNREVVTELGKAITVVNQQYLVMGSKSSCALVSLAKAEYLRVLGQLNTEQEGLKSQPLLVPLSLKLGRDLVEIASEVALLLQSFGIELKQRNSEAIMVMGVPSPLRQQNLQILIPDLLSYAASLKTDEKGTVFDEKALANWIAIQIAQVKSDYTLSEAIQLVGELEQLWHGQLPLEDSSFVVSVDFSTTIAALLA